jgi:hypothetical protein
MTNPSISAWVFGVGYTLAALYRAHRFPLATIRQRLQQVSE